MDNLQANSDLLIGQWQDSPRLRSAIDNPISVLNKEVLKAMEDLDNMRHIDTAEGVWLDFIGRKLGIKRPAVSSPADDSRFGFEGPAQSKGFDTAPFKGDVENDAVFPLPDEIFRRFLKARAVTLLSDGSFQAFYTSVLKVDPSANGRDNRNMTVSIVTSDQEILKLAESIGAFPRSTGVKIKYIDRNVFGYDESGVPFDQGPFRPV